MSPALALRRIIIPQAVRIVVPPVTNDFIAMFKDTSVCSVITVMELTKQYSVQRNDTGATLELAALTALLYLLMSIPLGAAGLRAGTAHGTGQRGEPSNATRRPSTAVAGRRRLVKRYADQRRARRHYAARAPRRSVRRRRAVGRRQDHVSAVPQRAGDFRAGRNRAGRRRRCVPNLPRARAQAARWPTFAGAWAWCFSSSICFRIARCWAT